MRETWGLRAPKPCDVFFIYKDTGHEAPYNTISPTIFGHVTLFFIVSEPVPLQTELAVVEIAVGIEGAGSLCLRGKSAFGHFKTDCAVAVDDGPSIIRPFDRSEEGFASEDMVLSSRGAEGETDEPP